MNKWKQLIAKLAEGDGGYKGDENDLAAVKKYVEDNGIDLVSETDGTPLDLDAMHKAAQRRTVKFNADPVPAKHAVRQPASRAAAIDDGQGPAIHSKVGSSGVGSTKKMYEQRAKQFGVGTSKDQTAFSDADTAEFLGAAFRLGFATRGHNTASYIQRENDEEIIAKSGSQFNPTTGGVLIPDDFRPQLIYLMEKYGIARQIANVVPMTRDNVQEPRITAVNAMVPIGELPTMALGDDNTDLVSLYAKDWGRITRFPNSLLQDAAISVTDIFARTCVEAQTKAEDQTYFLGDGSATYNQDMGLANALPSGAYIAASGNSWGAITEGDINKLPGSVENADIKTRGQFLCSRQFYMQVMQPMQTTSGRGFQVEFMNMSGLTSDYDALWKGWKVRFVQVLPTASGSAVKSLYFGDFQAASMLGDRRDLEIATSEHVYFVNNAFGVRAISRFTVNIHGDGRGSTFGPICCLKTT